ncbi:hypothetical protein C0995_012969 [Termitomyces sp. Mi166|nr:hypothetical protein C0995_012969 [Termitomyces sp. Mi166\
MPALLSQVTVTVYRSASSLPQTIWNAFKADPRNSNIIYSHAIKEMLNANQPMEGQVWIACTTNDTLDFILSCAYHTMGAYPILIYSAHPTSTLESQFVVPRIQLLANSLLKCVDVRRVYSVFAVDMVSRLFAETWSAMTDITFYKKPYYAAKLTFCTRQSFRARQFTVIPGISYNLRLAVSSDIPAVAMLCHGFAAEAEPFVLTVKEAVKEATHLINLKQLWVHTMEGGDQSTEIASIVAVTRESATVSTITKVFTNPNWRSQGCAERLVRKVTQILLKQKESVVLYVAHNNPAASKVYHRVGFVGLDKSMPLVDGVDSWLELGFDRYRVELGHW